MTERRKVLRTKRKRVLLLALVIAGLLAAGLWVGLKDDNFKNWTSTNKAEVVTFTYREFFDDINLEKGVSLSSTGAQPKILVSAGRIESMFGIRVAIHEVTIATINGVDTIQITAGYHNTDMAMVRKKLLNPRAEISFAQPLPKSRHEIKLNLIKIAYPQNPDWEKEGEQFETTLTVN